MSTELILFEKDNLDKLYKACDTLSKSQMIPVGLQGKPANIFAILVMGTELNIKPMQALNSINVIQGKPTVSPQLMIAMVKGKIPDSVIKIENLENGGARCTTARSMEEFKNDITYVSTWTIEKAKAMGLMNKDNYVKQAQTMLRWRAVAEACRITFPDVLMGMYATEEFQDFEGKMIDPEVVTKQSLRNMIDDDFPIPPEEKEVGDLYRVQNGTYRSKQLKDIPIDEIAEYREKLIKRTTPKKDWEHELIRVFGEYLNMVEGIQPEVME